MRLFGACTDHATTRAAHRRSTTSWSSRRALAVLSHGDAKRLIGQAGTDTPSWPAHAPLARLAAAAHIRNGYTGATSAVGCVLHGGDMPAAATVRAAQFAASNQEHILALYVSKSPSCPPVALTALADIGAERAPAGSDKDTMTAWAAWAEVAGHRNCPPSVIFSVAARGGHICRLSAARNPAAPAEALDMLVSGDEPYMVKIAALKNPSCGPATLDFAARGMKASYRRVVASHPNTTAATLELFIEDPDATTRAKAARHSLCPASALRRLATDADLKVRGSAAAALKRRSGSPR